MLAHLIHELAAIYAIEGNIEVRGGGVEGGDPVDVWIDDFTGEKVVYIG